MVVLDVDPGSPLQEGPDEVRAASPGADHQRGLPVVLRLGINVRLLPEQQIEAVLVMAEGLIVPAKRYQALVDYRLRDRLGGFEEVF